MFDTTVTLQGYAGGIPQLRDAGGSALATLRIGCTPSRFDAKTQSWVSGATQWYTVRAWRRLAENVAASIRSGDPIVVHGRLVVDQWTSKEGVDMSELQVEAITVGHDLTRGIARAWREPKQEAPLQSVDAAPIDVTDLQEEPIEPGAREQDLPEAS
jgi:single-strand DNA-binding protein